MLIFRSGAIAKYNPVDFWSAPRESIFSSTASGVDPCNSSFTEDNSSEISSDLNDSVSSSGEHRGFDDSGMTIVEPMDEMPNHSDETPPPTPPQEDEFHGLYILMEAAVAVMQQRDEQNDNNQFSA